MISNNYFPALNHLISWTGKDCMAWSHCLLFSVATKKKKQTKTV